MLVERIEVSHTHTHRTLSLSHTQATGHLPTF
jgi:hypothetical protein